jgi:hypothetical protein
MAAVSGGQTVTIRGRCKVRDEGKRLILGECALVSP